MRRFLNRRWLWSTAPLIVAGLSGLLLFCWSHRVWSVSEWNVYQAMEKECHPVWREFHYGHIRAGDSVEDVIARTDPVCVERTGKWVILQYHPDGMCFTGLTAAAYDGEMVGAYAWSCCWVRRFFDNMSESQRARFFEEFYDQPARVGDMVFVR